MRCPYCRSVTHEADCPKEMADKVMPIYAAIHKLQLIENRALGQQDPLYYLPEAKAVLSEVRRLTKEFVEGENAKTSAKNSSVASKNATKPA